MSGASSVPTSRIASSDSVPARNKITGKKIGTSTASKITSTYQQSLDMTSPIIVTMQVDEDEPLPKIALTNSAVLDEVPRQLRSSETKQSVSSVLIGCAKQFNNSQIP